MKLSDQNRTDVASVLASLRLGKPADVLKAIDSPTRQIIDGEASVPSPIDALDLQRRKRLDA